MKAKKNKKCTKNALTMPTILGICECGELAVWHDDLTHKIFCDCCFLKIVRYVSFSHSKEKNGMSTKILMAQKEFRYEGKK